MIATLRRWLGLTPPPHRHCWHWTDDNTLVDGAWQHNEKCCECAARRLSVYVHSPSPHHGVHQPEAAWNWTYKYTVTDE